MSDQKAQILSAFACTPWPRISGNCSSGGGPEGGTVAISIGPVAVGIPSSRRGSRVGPDIPESISTSKLYFVPRASIVSRRLHCSPGCFLRTDLHLSKPCFVPTRWSSDDTHVNDTHLFVALKDQWIEETIRFKMSQDFLRQILVTTFPSAHEADHHSTARFHECDTWLSFALCHCLNEHVICLEFR